MKRIPITQIVLGLLCLMYFITYVDRVNVSTASAGFGQEFGLNKTQIGFVFSAFAYPYLVFQIIGGWFSDRLGARRTLITFGAIWAVATVLTGMATGLVTLLLARLLLGFGEGATFPAATTAMSRWFPPEKRGYVQGITHAAARIGNAAAPGAIVAIMAAGGWRASFYVCALVSFAWVGLWAITFTDWPTDHPRITPQELAPLPVRENQTSSVPWPALFRRMAPVAVVYFCFGWNLWLFLSWIPQYFLHSYQLDLKQSAVFSAGVFFAGVLGDCAGGWVTDRIFQHTRSLTKARSWMVAACLLLAASTLIPLAFTHSLGVSLACLSAGFFFAEMTIGPMWALPMDIAPAWSGTASGMMNTGSATAAILSPVVSGYLIDRFQNWELPFVCDAVLMTLGLLLSFRMRPDDSFEHGGPPVTSSFASR